MPAGPVSSRDPRVASARFSWEEGVERLDAAAGPALARARRALVAAVHDELRRRVGATFTLAELAAVYEDASSWYFELAARVAPREPDAWEPAVTLDGAFGIYMRNATDAHL